MLTRNLILILLIGGGLGVGNLMVFWWFKRGEIQKKTWFYSIFMLILWGLLGLLGYFIKLQELNIVWILISQGLFFLMGVLHSWMIFNGFYWSQKAISDRGSYSFWPEWAYTIFICAWGGVAFSLVLWWITDYKESYIWLFSPGIAFVPIPFLLVSASGHLAQVPAKDFLVKWSYPNDSIKLHDWDWDNTLYIEFRVHRSLKREKIPFYPRDKRIITNSPIEISLGDLFRVSIDSYRKKYPDLTKQYIRDLRSAPDSAPFWWLFKVKFVPWRLHTWDRRFKLLNPHASLRQNGLKDGDIIIVKRVKYAP